MDPADDLDSSTQVFSGSGPTILPSTEFSGTFLQNDLAQKPWRKETHSSAKPHLSRFLFSLVPVSPFETLSGLSGRQIFCYMEAWALELGGRG